MKRASNPPYSEPGHQRGDFQHSGQAADIETVAEAVRISADTLEDSLAAKI
jgi:hypothetical protein